MMEHLDVCTVLLKGQKAAYFNSYSERLKIKNNILKKGFN